MELSTASLFSIFFAGYLVGCMTFYVVGLIKMGQVRREIKEILDLLEGGNGV